MFAVKERKDAVFIVEGKTNFVSVILNRERNVRPDRDDLVELLAEEPGYPRGPRPKSQGH